MQVGRLRVMIRLEGGLLVYKGKVPKTQTHPNIPINPHHPHQIHS